MFTYLIKVLLAGITVKLLDSYRHLSIQLLAIEAATCYVRGVRMMRLSAIRLMRMVLLIGLIGGGALLFHAALFILLPWSLEAKAALCMGLGLAYMAVGYMALRAVMDEKAWMKMSGAAKMVEDAAGQAGKG